MAHALDSIVHSPASCTPANIRKAVFSSIHDTSPSRAAVTPPPHFTRWTPPSSRRTAHILCVNLLPMGEHLALRFKLAPSGLKTHLAFNECTNHLSQAKVSHLWLAETNDDRRPPAPRREDPAVRRLLFVSRSPCDIFYSSHNSFPSEPAFSISKMYHS